MISRQVILMLCFLNDSKHFAIFLNDSKHFAMVMNHSFYALCKQIILSSPNFKNSLAYSGPVVWNSLAKEIKMTTSSEAIHSRCVKWMKS